MISEREMVGGLLSGRLTHRDVSGIGSRGFADPQLGTLFAIVASFRERGSEPTDARIAGILGALPLHVRVGVTEELARLRAEESIR